MATPIGVALHSRVNGAHPRQDAMPLPPAIRASEPIAETDAPVPNAPPRIAELRVDPAAGTGGGRLLMSHRALLEETAVMENHATGPEAPEAPARNTRSFWNAFTIEQGFQQRQILRLLGLTVLNVGVSTIAFVALHRHQYVQQWGDLGAGPGPDLVNMAISWAALMGGMGGFFAVCMGLLMTHRMAGPIHQFKAQLARIARGETLVPIRVRAKDEFADLAEALNRALETLAGRPLDDTPAALALDLDRLRTTHDEIFDGIESLDCGELPEHACKRVEAWRMQMRALRSKLDADASAA